MIPAEHSRLIVENELEGARSWAERYGVHLKWLPEGLILQATLVQPETNAIFYLCGSVADYRALPPAWTFTDKEGQTTGRPIDFPGGVPTRFGASMFITHNQTAVICVPFNRLAYTDQGGPHGDWGGSANWLNAGPSYVHADTIGDMLQAIYRDFRCTQEYMAKS